MELRKLKPEGGASGAGRNEADRRCRASKGLGGGGSRCLHRLRYGVDRATLAAEQKSVDL